ncbi:hypothetical protein CORC01_09724, partial [Colletotrichum orchidophilum]
DASTPKEYSRPSSPLLIVFLISTPEAPVESQDQRAAADHVKFQTLVLVLCQTRRHGMPGTSHSTVRSTPAASLSLEYLTRKMMCASQACVSPLRSYGGPWPTYTSCHDG